MKKKYLFLTVFVLVVFYMIWFPKDRIVGTVYVNGKAYTCQKTQAIMDGIDEWTEQKVSIYNKDVLQIPLLELYTGNPAEQLKTEISSIYEKQTVVDYGRTYTVSLTGKINSRLLGSKLEEQNSGAKPPENAYIRYDDKQKKYTIVKEVPGTVIDINNAVDTVIEEVENGNYDVDISGCRVEPEISCSDDSVAQICRLGNEYLIDLSIRFGEKNESITKDQIAGWMQVESDKIVFDKAKIREYVIKLAKKYDTYGKEREFITHSGEKTLIKKGAYGWMIRRDKTVNRIIKTIKKKKDSIIEPVYSYKAYCRTGSDDIGDTYIEVSIQNQHVWIYRGGKEIYDSSCVTGCVDKGHSTPTGIYSIAYKTRNKTLRGRNNSYASFVSYWMPFYDGCGLHDATWRSSFGGQIYKTNGSHGCINLPFSSAEKIYSLIQEGEPIIIY